MSIKEAVEHTERAAGGVFDALGAGIGELSDEIARLRRCNKALQHETCNQADEIARLEAANAELVAAVSGLVPSSRAAGCWCPNSWDFERHGHSQQCQRAIAALAHVLPQTALAKS